MSEWINEWLKEKSRKLRVLLSPQAVCLCSGHNLYNLRSVRINFILQKQATGFFLWPKFPWPSPNKILNSHLSWLLPTLCPVPPTSLPTSHGTPSLIKHLQFYLFARVAITKYDILGGLTEMYCLMDLEAGSLRPGISRVSSFSLASGWPSSPCVCTPSSLYESLCAPISPSLRTAVLLR